MATDSNALSESALQDLAERIEAADAGSRELDALIWIALNGKKYKGHFPAYGRHYGEENPLTQVEYTEPPKRTRMVTGDRGPFRHALPWTTSLDAAMTLVPEGMDWIIGHTNGGLTIHAEVGGRGDEYMRFAATPALAMCAASLRARRPKG